MTQDIKSADANGIRNDSRQDSTEAQPETSTSSWDDMPEQNLESVMLPTNTRPDVSLNVQHHPKPTRSFMIAIIAILAIAGLFFAGFIAHRIATTLPEQQEALNTNVPTESFNTVPTHTPDILPTPTGEVLTQYEQLDAQADKTIITDGILNILLIGVDYADERMSEEWDGKQAFHADVMMIAAINFKDHTVDLISLPRDTYAEIPYVEGIYKLNASLDCGGGMNENGYNKVCEAAEWMLGGISVDYYYAVTMPAVKRLGDAVGGVDYDVEMDFAIGGRTYKAGMQHLDGQGILDYLRVRKNIQGAGDLNRINRQKKMLLALFDAMKQANKLLLIPDIIKSFEGDIATNTTLPQTMALALWSLDLDPTNIEMHSMKGTTQNIFGWNFCLTNQKHRVRLIKDIYDVSVSPYYAYSQTYAEYRWQDMLCDYAIKISSKLITDIEKDFGQYFPKPQETTPPDSTTQPTPTVSAGFNLTDDQYKAYTNLCKRYKALIEAQTVGLKQAKRYLQNSSNQLSKSTEDMHSTLIGYQEAVELASWIYGYDHKYNWVYQYWLDPEFNEKIIDFR